MIDAIANIWTSGWLSARALFHWLMPSAYVPSLVLGPALQVAFFGLVITYSGHGAKGAVAGLVLLNAAVAGLNGGLMVVAGDRWYGTLEPVTHTPLPVSLRLAGRLIPIVVYATATSLILLAGTVLLGLIAPDRLLPVAILALAGAAAVSALGMLAGTLGLLVPDAFVWGSVLFLLLQTASGALLPRADLPGPVKVITTVLPLTHGVEAAKTIAVSGGGFPAAAIGWELSICAVLVLATAALSRRLERVAARTGSLAFT